MSGNWVTDDRPRFAGIDHASRGPSLSRSSRCILPLLLSNPFCSFTRLPAPTLFVRSVSSVGRDFFRPTCFAESLVGKSLPVASPLVFSSLSLSLSLSALCSRFTANKGIYREKMLMVLRHNYPIWISSSAGKPRY